MAQVTAKSDSKPLVYACSGCSNVAQLANSVAVYLDRQGWAEMSCIAGVGGNVKPLVRKAQSAPVCIAIDGCPLACAKACLTNVQVNPSLWVRLDKLGKKKRYGEDCNERDVQETIDHVLIKMRQMGLVDLNEQHSGDVV